MPLSAINTPSSSGNHPRVGSPYAPEEEIGIDTALQRTVGEFGRGQQLFYCLAQLAWIPAAMQTMVMIYTGLDPITQQWYTCHGGKKNKGACLAVMNGNATDSSIEFCKLPAGSYRWSRSADSIVSEWNLVCNDLWKQQAVNSAFFGGFLIGAGLFGALADRLGRKKALLIALLIGGCSGIFCGFAHNYWAFVFWRFNTGVGVAGIGMVAYVLGTEYVGPSWRGFLGVAAQYPFAIGCVLMPFLAYYVPSWRVLCFLTGGTSLLYMLVLPSLPESPRWQLIAGRKGDATATLAAIASYNGTHLPDVPLSDVAVSSGTGAGIGDVIAHSVLRYRLFVQLVAWFAISSSYYGISLMVADLPGSVYTNNAILGAIEILAYFGASVLVERLGRRWTIAGSYLMAGFCLILSASTSGTLSIVLAVGAKCGAASAFALIILFAAELFPTVVRSVCIGVSSQAARVGGMVTPVIILAAHQMHAPLFAFVVLGLLSTFAGLLLLTQPETLGSTLPETIEDVGQHVAPTKAPSSSSSSSANVGGLLSPTAGKAAPGGAGTARGRGFTSVLANFYNRGRGFSPIREEEHEHEMEMAQHSPSSARRSTRGHSQPESSLGKSYEYE